MHENPDQESVLNLPDHDYESVRLLVDSIYAFLAHAVDGDLNLARSADLVETLGLDLSVPLAAGMGHLLMIRAKLEAPVFQEGYDEEDPDFDPFEHLPSK